MADTRIVTKKQVVEAFIELESQMRLYPSHYPPLGSTHEDVDKTAEFNAGEFWEILNAGVAQ